MRTLVILLFAIGVAAGAVLMITPLQERRRPRRPRRIRFRESFQTTAPMAARTLPTGGGFAYEPSATRDQRPPAPWSLVKIVATIVFVAAAGAALVWFGGSLLGQRIEQLFTS